LGLHRSNVVQSDGKRVIDQIIGTGTVDEFLELLEDIRDSLKRREFYKYGFSLDRYIIWLLLFSTVGLGFVISKSKETRAKWREILNLNLLYIAIIIRFLPYSLH